MAVKSRRGGVECERGDGMEGDEGTEWTAGLVIR